MCVFENYYHQSNVYFHYRSKSDKIVKEKKLHKIGVKFLQVAFKLYKMRFMRELIDLYTNNRILFEMITIATSLGRIDTKHHDV